MKSTYELIQQGIANLQAKHAEGEVTKLGNLRIGGTGSLAFDGKVIGACMRTGYLRQQGIEFKGTDEDREHMFAGGRSNEETWAELLGFANEPGVSWKREEEYPVNAITSNGTPISGRPDFVLFQDDKPVRILELKQVSSLHTALDVGITLKPKLGHLQQAAHYSLRLGLPVELWYTSRSDYHITEFKQDTVPPNHPRVVYNWKGRATKTSPFIQGYELAWSAKGQLTYRALPDGIVTPTIITKDGILDYFEQQSKMKETDELPPKPSPIDHDGDKMGWRMCDYCELKTVCSEYKGASVKEWTSNVLKFVKKDSDKK